MRKLLVLAAVFLTLYAIDFRDEFAKPDGLPDSYVHNEYYGTVYKRPTVTTESRAQVYWAQDLAEEYTGPRTRDAPASLVAGVLSGSCELPRPSAGTQLVFVEIYSGYDKTPLHFVDHDYVKAVRRSIEAKSKRPVIDRRLHVDTAYQVDVFITEKEQPVYLVLATYAATVWSLQIADGARIDGVAIIGYEPQALAHAPENMRVGFAVYSDSPQRSCMESPQHPVNDSWKAVERASDNLRGRGFRKTIDEASQQHYRYRHWLHSRVGSPHREIDAYRTAHVLVGPKPHTPLRYRPLKGAPLLFTPNAVPVWADQDDVADVIQDYVKNRS